MFADLCESLQNGANAPVGKSLVMYSITSNSFLTFTYVDNLFCPSVFFNSIEQTLSAVGIGQGTKG